MTRRLSSLRLGRIAGVALLSLCSTGLSGVSIVPASASGSGTVPLCSYGQLEVAVGQGPGGFAGNLGIPIIIVNASGSACSLNGYPGVHLYTGAVQQHRITVGHAVAGGVYAPRTPKVVVIDPDSVASFGVNYEDALNQSDSNGPACTADAANIALPVTHNTRHLRYGATVLFNICYSGFHVSVTPVEPGPRPTVN